MKWFLLVLPALLASCTLHVKGVCTSGPEKGKAVTADVGYTGLTTSGKIKLVTPWGEIAEGRYITHPYHGSTKAWDAQEKRDGTSTESSGDDVIIESDGTTQVGTATLLGNQGTVIESVYWGSAWSPTHGQGKAKDSRGNRYKLVW